MPLPSFLTASAWKTVASPVVALGGALLAGGALLTVSMPPTSVAVGPTAAYRLSLHTPQNQACYFGSAWNDGDLVLAHDASDGHVVTLTGHYDFVDGCTWEVTETLVPTADGYDYAYSEKIASCRPGARPARACSRAGHVDVVAVE